MYNVRGSRTINFFVAFPPSSGPSARTRARNILLYYNNNFPHDAVMADNSLRYGVSFDSAAAVVVIIIFLLSQHAPDRTCIITFVWVWVCGGILPKRVGRPRRRRRRRRRRQGRVKPWPRRDARRLSRTIDIITPNYGRGGIRPGTRPMANPTRNDATRTCRKGREF